MEANALKVVEIPTKKDKKPRRERGDGGLFRLGKMWYTKVRGKRESTGTRIKEEAKETLKARMGRTVLGIPDPADLRRIKYEDGRAAVLADYAHGKKHSLITKADGTVTVWGLKHLDKFFGDKPLVDIESKMLEAFIKERQNYGAAPGTINRNLALLRRMFKLLKRSNSALNVPYFPRLKEAKPRQGFIEHENFAKLFAELPERLHSFVIFLYTTGCRSGEAKKLRWNQIDWNERLVYAEAEQTKNNEPRTIPLADEVFNRLSKIPEAKRAGLLFPVGNFRKAWQSACVRAGLGVLTKGPTNGGYGKYAGLTPHDMRRSAVRNLRKEGVGEVVAMSVSGHKTAEVFRRYNIVVDADKTAAVALIGSRLGQVLRKEKRKK